MKPTPSQICTRCVMDTSDPEIRFDANGICNHCHDYDVLSAQVNWTGKAGEQELQRIVERIKQEGKGKDYDCVIGVSGGVDSTYVAYKVKQLGLRPLAIHLDNGWDSEMAVKNIENALNKLDIELYTHVIDWEEFRDIQLSFLRASTPDSEIPSDHAIVSIVHQMTEKIGVRYNIWGYNVRTETHLPTSWSQGHWDWLYIKGIHKQFGKRKIKTFPHMTLFDLGRFGRTQERVNLLDYIDYSKKDAMKILESELGWRYYGGKHFESIYTRFYQGYILPRKFGYDKRKTHLSSLICSGEITREQALEELKQPTYDPKLQAEDKEYVTKKLGLTEAEFEAILNLPHKSFADYPSYAKLKKQNYFKVAHNLYRTVKGRKSEPAASASPSQAVGVGE